MNHPTGMLQVISRNHVFSPLIHGKTGKNPKEHINIAIFCMIKVAKKTEEKYGFDCICIGKSIHCQNDHFPLDKPILIFITFLINL